MTAATADVTRTLPGSQFPLGATVTDTGTNFAVASGVADGMLLCLFDETGAETQIPMQDRDADVWHVFVPGVGVEGSRQAYGYRATGPYDPARGVRCNPAKLLLDPYARALDGTVWFGPEVLGYSGSDQDVPNGSRLRALRPAQCRGGRRTVPVARRMPSGGAGTRTPSSTRCTSRASPCATPGCRPNCAAPTPASAMRRPSPTWWTWA